MKAHQQSELQPPDEAFWLKYNPHHEFPLSTVVSIFVHVGLIVFLLVLLAGLLDQGDTTPVPIRAVEIGGDDGGSAGSTAGDPNGPERQDEQPPQEQPSTPEPPPELPSVRVRPSELPPELQQDPDATRAIAEATKANDELAKLNEKIRQDLFKGLAKRGTGGPAGQPGTGGSGPAGTGPGDKGPGSKTATRVMRWTMSFNTTDGNDYLRQLRVMGAILAFPQPDGRVRVYRDLRRGARWQIEDIGKINRMFWVDSSPDAMYSLRMALGMNFTPGQVIAFFPDELEKRLLSKELSYQGLSEDQILQTTFRITVGLTSYDIMVIRQERK